MNFVKLEAKAFALQEKKETPAASAQIKRPCEDAEKKMAIYKPWIG